MLEALVAVAVAGVIFSGAFSLLIDGSRIHHRESQVSEMRQSARSAGEFIVRDLVNAGYGLASARPVVAAVIANEPTNTTVATSTAITIRANTADVQTTLSEAMPQPSAELKVTSIDGFVEGQRCLVWDATGSWDWMLVTHVQTSSHLQHNTTTLSKSYDPDDGTVIAVVDEISYRYDAAVEEIQRMLNGGPWIPVAQNVTAFQLRYYDKGNTELMPATDDQRRAIRTIAVNLTVRTDETDRRTRKFESYAVRTQVTPRNLPNLPV